MKRIRVGGTHREIGAAIGRRFRGEIADAVATHERLRNAYLPYHATDEGRERYRRLRALHRTRYPRFLDEMEGLAEGAGVAFEELFLLNLRAEYLEYSRPEPEPDSGCSTLSICADGHRTIYHNEDGAPLFEEKLYFVEAQPPGQPAFGALCYPGFLCGNAFGFNAEGICVAVNNVRPSGVTDGVGRHFIARSLFEARTVDEAVALACPTARASGFAYTIGSTVERRIVLVETSPTEQAVREIDGPYFHTNHYRELTDVEQKVTDSSRSRLERAAAMTMEPGPGNADEALRVMTDRQDGDFPIFRTGLLPDTLMTFVTARFDLDARILEIFEGPPETWAEPITFSF